MINLVRVIISLSIEWSKHKHHTYVNILEREENEEYNDRG
jgi:hypothetical protein